MKARHSPVIYIVLIAGWVLFASWQAFEHARVRTASAAGLRSRARDISTSLGIVIRSQGRFGVISRQRLEAAVSDLSESHDIEAIALLNSRGEIVASAGEEPLLKELPDRETWTRERVALVNLVDLGASSNDEPTTQPAAIIIDRPPEGSPGGGRSRGPGGPGGPGDAGEDRPPPPPGEGPPSRPGGPDGDDGDRRRDDRREGFGRGSDRMTTETMAELRAEAERVRADLAAGRRRFFRPPWMTPEEFEEMLLKQGLHGFVLWISTDSYRAETSRDLWLRLALACIALAAVGGVALAWRSLERAADLQLRLVRASEMNARLREMNVAAAGLAHETRNPLNIVRGLAHMLAENAVLPGESRDRARRIEEEVDRVTGRLNEFIDYSRPLEPRRGRVNLRSVVEDVRRTLESDREDKDIAFEVEGPDVVIDADEALLRQVLFNLLLNAFQAVDEGGRVGVVVRDEGHGSVAVEVCDNGAGVPPDQREQIFRPYFTTRAEGSGLGLAIVRQIALAHGWEAEYLPGEEGGSRLSISGLRVL